MDPLEDVLSLLDATGHVSTGLSAGGPWAIRFLPPAGVKFNAVRRGRCWLRVDEVPDPVRLDAGDCFLLTRPLAFTLASDLELPAEPARPIFAAAVDGLARAGAGDDVLLIGGAFSFTGRARAAARQPAAGHPRAGRDAGGRHRAVDGRGDRRRAAAQADGVPRSLRSTSPWSC
nr:cupin domain-containing protein [Micromonospora kangleipakensis]